jgi:PAS domain S-box-containing protein
MSEEIKSPEQIPEALRAIRGGEVDALVVEGPQGPCVFSLEGAERAYRVFLDTMDEGAITATAEGTILFCNRRFILMLGLHAEQIMGRSLGQFVPEPHRAEVEWLLTQARGGSARKRIELIGANGASIPVQISANPIPDDEAFSLSIVVTDLTDVEAAHRELKKEIEFRKRVEADLMEYTRSTGGQSRGADIGVARERGTASDVLRNGGGRHGLRQPRGEIPEGQ